jgi:hypothetical protein
MNMEIKENQKKSTLPTKISTRKCVKRKRKKTKIKKYK